MRPLRDAFKGLPVNLENVREAFTRISSRISGSKVIFSSSNLTVYLAIQLDSDVLFDLRVSSAVVEMYVEGRLLSVLGEVGFSEILEVLEGYHSSVKSISISKAVPSGSLYIVIQGDNINMPNVRLVVTRDYFDLSSSFCRISSTGNTCILLSKILEVGRGYFKDFVESTAFSKTPT
ncbi:MAG: hypothetical protein NZ925_00895 [Sulfolobales archaeon]|nr:hypothetical protein [Sulfolobales archaeon]